MTSALEQAIRDAVEKGGWVCGACVEPLRNYHWYKEAILLDPAFWQALGKARGWRLKATASNGELYQLDEWPRRWLDLIRHLASGKDVESFFEGL